MQQKDRGKTMEPDMFRPEKYIFSLSLPRYMMVDTTPTYTYTGYNNVAPVFLSVGRSVNSSNHEVGMAISIARDHLM